MLDKAFFNMVKTKHLGQNNMDDSKIDYMHFFVIKETKITVL